MAQQPLPTEDNHDNDDNNTDEAKEMEIVIKTLSGKSINVNIKPNNTILDIKQKIHEKDSKFPANLTRLIFSGRPLQDNDSASQHKIKDGSTLHLIMRLRSGVNMNSKRINITIRSKTDNVKNDIKLLMYSEDRMGKLFCELACRTNLASTLSTVDGKELKGSLKQNGIKDGHIIYAEYYKPSNWSGQMYVIYTYFSFKS